MKEVWQSTESSPYVIARDQPCAALRAAVLGASPPERGAEREVQPVEAVLLRQVKSML